MSRVSNGQSDEAFTFLLKEYWSDRTTVPQATVEMQREYRAVVGRAEQTIGKAVPGGYELIGVKRLGGSVLKLVYLEKNELSFLPWAFSFYKANQDWHLIRVTFPDIGSDDIHDFTLIVPADGTNTLISP